ncbi:MAG: DUF2341 domain-containing protein [Candidatus Thorarchaeota archaeon]
MIIILTLPMVVDASVSETETTLTSLEIELSSGNSVDWDRTPIVSTDVTGVLQIDFKKEGYADVQVVFKDGKTLATAESSSTPLTKEITTYSDDYEGIRIGITDTKNRIFLSLIVLENGSLYVSVSTIISSVTYCGTALIQSWSITKADWDIILLNYHTTTESFVDLARLPDDFDRTFKEESTIRAASLSGEEGERSKSGDKIFYLAHYSTGLLDYKDGYYEYLETTVLENSYCTDFFSRSNPTVDNIQCDLSAYCNRYNDNYLGIYHLAFHGNFHEDERDSYSSIFVNSGILDNDHISDVWELTYVDPVDAIVIAYCCHSLHDKKYSEDNPQWNIPSFCDAFLELDYMGENCGAKAYIGGENGISGPSAPRNPKKRDKGTPTLIECLADSDMSVSDAVRFVNERELVVDDCLHFRIQEDLSTPVYLENDDGTEPAFPDEWTFHKTHTIKKATGAGTGYQISVRVHYGLGDDDGPDVYLQNGDGIPHCQVDFDDVRFVWLNVTNDLELLDYWIEDIVVTNDSHYADFWIELREDLSTEEREIRIYYGDIGACAATDCSNGTATFPLFDDFSGYSVDTDVWNLHSNVSPSVSDGLLRINGSEDGDVLTSVWENGGASYIYEIYTKMDKDSDIDVWGGFWLFDQYYDDYKYSKGYLYRFFSEQKDESRLCRSTGSYLFNLADGDTIGDDTWTRLRLFHFGSAIGDLDGLGLNCTSSFYSSGGFGIGKSAETNLLVDWVFARKFSQVVPQHDVWGPEKPFMEGWSHRKAHVIKGVSGTGSGYQIQITVHRCDSDETYYDSGNHIYVGTDVKEDFGDIRFLDELSHITMKPNFLNQWRERIWTENNPEEHQCASFWVKVSESLDTDQTLYIYYGNSMATTNNQPQLVFEFFDDFSIGLRVWNSTNQAGLWCVYDGAEDIEIDDGILKMYDCTAKIYSVKNFNPGVAYHARVRFGDYRSSGFMQTTATGNVNFGGDLAIWDRHSTVQRVDVENNGNEDIVSVTQTVDSWQTHSICWYSDSYVQSFLDDTSKSNHTTYIPDGSPEIPIYLYTCSGDQQAKLEVDYIFVRKCTYPEPSHGIWGSEVDLDSSDGVWEYRRSHKLIGNTSVGTDYQVKFKVYYSSGSSSGNTVYLNTKGASDFSDVRFTNDDGTELLDYWCEYYVTSSTAEFWVEVSDDLNSNQTIYVYYGFDGAVSSSDGHATFEWFEDFEDESLNSNPDSTQWEDPIDDDGTFVDVVGDPDSNEDDQALKICNDGDDVTTYVQTKSMGLSSRDYAIGWRWYRADDQYCYLRIYGTSSTITNAYSGYVSGDYDDWKFSDGSWHQPSPDWAELEEDEWSRIEIQFYASSISTLWDVSNDTTHTIVTRNAYPSTSGYLDTFRPIFSNRYRTQTLYTDDIYVRKYVGTEPGHGDWGAEEALT